MALKKALSMLFMSLPIIVLVSCTSGSSSSSTSSSPATGTATVFWNPVSTYTDGTAFSPVGYKIYYGTAPGHYAATVTVTAAQITDPNSPRYTVVDLSLGTRYYFSVSAYDSQNVESALSTEVSKTIN